MKIIGTDQKHHPTYTLQATCWEIEKIAGWSLDGRNHLALQSGSVVEVGALWARLHALEEAIKLAWPSSPKYLRSLADHVEAVVPGITPPDPLEG